MARGSRRYAGKWGERAGQAPTGAILEIQDLPNHQNLEGCELAIVRLSLRVEKQKDAEHDHQKGPEAREGRLPARGQLRQSFENANTEAGGGETQVLGLDASHHRHVVRTAHTAVVLVKKEHHRTTESKHGEHPRGPS